MALSGRAVLITGPSGAGKSGLALQLMAFGAALVADDRTVLTVEDGALIAACPAAIAGRIEARGVGILNAIAEGPAEVSLAVDMGTLEVDRLPPRREAEWLGLAVPLLHKRETPCFAAAVWQYLKAGRAE